MYEKIYQSDVTVNTTSIPNPYWQGIFYLRDRDAYLAVDYNNYAMVYRDGSTIFFGKRSGGYEPVARVDGLLAWWHSWTGKLHPAYQVTHLPNPNEVFNPTWNTGYDMNPDYFRGAFLDDRHLLYLYQPNARRINIVSLETGQIVGQIDHNTGEYFCTLAWVQEGQVVGICRDGRVRIMSYLGSLKTVVESDTIESFRVAAYDSEHHLFFAVGTDYKARLYCREILSDYLSAPTFESASVYGLKANKLTCRLTRGGGKPAKGWWVHWELEGVGGPPLGRLDKEVTETDEDGYARNYYFGPDEGLTGTNKIKVRVVTG